MAWVGGCQPPAEPRVRVPFTHSSVPAPSGPPRAVVSQQEHRGVPPLGILAGTMWLFGVSFWCPGAPILPIRVTEDSQEMRGQASAPVGSRCSVPRYEQDV